MLPLLSKDESYLLEVVDGSVLQLLSGNVNFSVLVFLRVGVWCGRATITVNYNYINILLAEH